jgi:hypothetical protein
MLPGKSTIVFSNYCYYNKFDKEFVVMFVNTTNIPLVNAEMCSLLKLNRDWTLYPSYRSPYIGSSTWTFSIDKFDIDEFKKSRNQENLNIYQDDGVKFGIVGTIGFAVFSTAVKYSLDEIIIIKNKEELTINASLRNPDFCSDAFKSSFHYRPQNFKTFEEYIREHGFSIIE